MNEIMCWSQVRAQQVRLDKTQDSYKKKNDAENLANSLCHDLCLISSMKVDHCAAAARKTRIRISITEV